MSDREVHDEQGGAGVVPAAGPAPGAAPVTTARVRLSARTSASPGRSGAASRRAGSREDAILAAAARLFHDRGFDRVGVDEIGQLAGISGPAIYRYFAGKDEILATLFDAAMDRLLLLCGNLPDDPDRALERLVVAHVEFAVQDSALLSVYAREERSLAEPWRRRLQRRQREHLDRWVDTLARCFPHRSAVAHQAGAHAAIGMVHSVAEWPRSARRETDLSATMVGLVRYGLTGLTRRDGADGTPERHSPD